MEVHKPIKYSCKNKKTRSDLVSDYNYQNRRAITENRRAIKTCEISPQGCNQQNPDDL